MSHPSSTDRLLDTKHCAGCENNFYNGNNPYGVTACWSRKDAKLEKRIQISVDVPPPYKGYKSVSRPTCYHIKRYVFVSPNRIDSQGYWK